mmetsp:Transcript_25147/g.50005  ORF Transcript_25147/g.50005 Transcript_25147/m.50005 type:complete len:115 (-) Transcript_25147:283-627(-)|eukprot:CAMPEP_0194330956 /NCGR_PEP_ID=MMETSP0171-20130528/53850_1 /TAXON_ID=218684 /ORGANISM="Corethron pennatum, Strain L29A3" /LENGTH=114 /DNA_ID=CAMNT_0039092219 /DNA_START=130 /DNA_END=474 /DNA_ORIENTATION=+
MNPITEWIKNHMEDPEERDRKFSERVILMDLKSKMMHKTRATAGKIGGDMGLFHPEHGGKLKDPRPFLHVPVMTAVAQQSQNISYGMDLNESRSDMMKKRIADACADLSATSVS